ncbi:acylphosphatase [Candidatus Desulforudis audaxviator]|uniref:Acylphosphatase n=1 Tax=Desulforudis audaxviator (strain MP104C) TaxID=477974 RepID=B1I448_DESAP|nr:acylphosphatase [Candidatus Desulforudis audaxviator]ACA59669.1 acylphosphatase [Candidatus Desulforudis audaxviator MP104C]AZK59661.1 Acylphosphate phosphohydrolase [Candidatus Desulforudis audaxviator]
MSQVRAEVAITGKVQGVYFRAAMLEEAEKRGVTGWVRNRSDGTVEGVLEGSRLAVQEVLDWCRQGPPGAVVKQVEINWQTPSGKYSGFEIRETI